MTLESAKKFVAQSEKYLGTPPSADRHITEATARGLVGLLEGLQAKHQDLANKSAFSPYNFTGRTTIFLNSVAEREMEGGKAPSNNLAVAYNLVKYINTGRLPDETPFVRPSVTMPWATSKQKDLFFNVDVYNELGIDLTPHDPRRFVGGQNWVSHKALFHPANANPAQQKMIEEVARDLKIEGRKLKISSDGTKVEHSDRDPNAMTYYSLDTIAKMSTEILARQAKAICGVKEGGITQAIMTRQYMPHLMDMRLAEHGFGKPAYWEPARLIELQDIGIIPESNNQPDARFDIYRTPQITSFQSQAWAKRFGIIDPSLAEQIARDKAPESNPGSTVYDRHGNPQVARDWIRETHQSPYSFYGLPYNTGRSKLYEDKRENIYLPRLNWRMHNGLDLCNADIGSSRDFGRAAASSFSGGDKVGDNAKDTTGQTRSTPPAGNAVNCDPTPIHVIVNIR